MKRLMLLILSLPFLIVTLYWGIEKYIYMLFEIEDKAGTTFVSLFLTLMVTSGLFCVFAKEKIE